MNKVGSKWEKKIFFNYGVYFTSTPMNTSQLTVSCIDENMFIFSVSTFPRASLIYLMVINNPLDNIWG